jgi:hypothetical protein
VTWSTHAVPALFTRRQQHHPKVSTGFLTATKKRPGKSTLPGLLQVVASPCRFLYPGGDGVSGDGDRRSDWAY